MSGGSLSSSIIEWNFVALGIIILEDFLSLLNAQVEILDDEWT